MAKSKCGCDRCPKHANVSYLPGKPANYKAPHAYKYLEDLIASTTAEGERAGGTSGALFDGFATALKSVGVREGMGGSMTGRLLFLLDDEIRSAKTSRKAEKLVDALGYIARLTSFMFELLELDFLEDGDVTLSTTKDLKAVKLRSYPKSAQPADNAELLEHLTDLVADTREQAEQEGGIKGRLLHIVANCEEDLGVVDGYVDAGDMTNRIENEILEGHLEPGKLMGLFKYTSTLTSMLYTRVGQWMVEERLKKFGKVSLEEKSGEVGEGVVGGVGGLDVEEGKGGAEGHDVAIGLGVMGLEEQAVVVVEQVPGEDSGLDGGQSTGEVGGLSLEDAPEEESHSKGDKLVEDGVQVLEKKIVAVVEIEPEDKSVEELARGLGVMTLEEMAVVALGQALREKNVSDGDNFVEGLGVMSLEEKLIAVIRGVFKNNGDSEGDKLAIGLEQMGLEKTKSDPEGH